MGFMNSGAGTLVSLKNMTKDGTEVPAPNKSYNGTKVPAPNN